MTRPQHGTVEGPWTPERVEQQLLQSRRFVERAIFAMHYRQKPAQQAGEDTGDHDRVGFNRWDKHYMKKLIDWMEASREPEGHRLTVPQLRAAVITLRRYAPQLSDLANRREQIAQVLRDKESVCPLCNGAKVIQTQVFGETLMQPCPKCGDTSFTT